jgi:hypothetical protein
MPPWTIPFCGRPSARAGPRAGQWRGAGSLWGLEWRLGEELGPCGSARRPIRGKPLPRTWADSRAREALNNHHGGTAEATGAGVWGWACDAGSSAAAAGMAVAPQHTTPPGRPQLHHPAGVNNVGQGVQHPARHQREEVAERQQPLGVGLARVEIRNQRRGECDRRLNRGRRVGEGEAGTKVGGQGGDDS